MTVLIRKPKNNSSVFPAWRDYHDRYHNKIGDVTRVSIVNDTPVVWLRGCSEMFSIAWLTDIDNDLAMGYKRKHWCAHNIRELK